MKLFGTMLVAAALALSGGLPAHAEDCRDATRDISAEIVVFDALVVRPVGIVATAIGAVFYVAALPFSLPSGSEGAARDKLIAGPAQFTFSRCLGDFWHGKASPRISR